MFLSSFLALSFKLEKHLFLIALLDKTWVQMQTSLYSYCNRGVCAGAQCVLYCIVMSLLCPLLCPLLTPFDWTFQTSQSGSRYLAHLLLLLLLVLSSSSFFSCFVHLFLKCFFWTDLRAVEADKSDRAIHNSEGKEKEANSPWQDQWSCTQTQAFLASLDLSQHADHSTTVPTQWLHRRRGSCDRERAETRG